MNPLGLANPEFDAAPRTIGLSKRDRREADQG